MSRKFRLGLIQMDGTIHSEENYKFIEKMAEAAKGKGAELIILPEHSDALTADNYPYADHIPGTVSSFYSALAEKYGLYVHCGSIPEKSDTGRSYNTSVVFGPDGRILGKYRKLHMFDVDVEGGLNIKESDRIQKGDFITVTETPLCPLGLTICYDVRFPELYRILALNGAELLIVSANFTKTTGAAHWETLLRARAIENTCYVAAVDQCGKKPLFEAHGHTMFIDPYGVIIGELKDKPGLLLAEFDPERLSECRKSIPSLQNRRSDVYSLLSK